MKTLSLLCAALMAASTLGAQEKSPSPSTPSAPSAPAVPVAIPVRDEPFLLLPEPREMRVGHSVVVGDAKHTVFSPVRRAAGKTTLEAYSKAEFTKLGISPDSFLKKAQTAADRLLATMQPELIKDDAGRVRYAVYRGEEPIYACLLVAPSLSTIFENVFGKEVWIAAPDRNALYVFPANATIVDDFAGDLEERFEMDAFAASEEVFVLRLDTRELRAVGTFRNRWNTTRWSNTEEGYHGLTDF